MLELATNTTTPGGVYSFPNFETNGNANVTYGIGQTYLNYQYTPIVNAPALKNILKNSII